MIAPGILLMFAGYSLGSYGYVLVKGWNITLRQWLSPTNPWTWQPDPQPLVPQGQIMPTGQGGAAPAPTPPAGNSGIPANTNYPAGQVAGVNPTISNVAGRGR